MISLEQFNPISEAVVKKTKIDQAKYPVIDFHTHMGKLLLKDQYDFLYDTETFCAELDSLNIKHSVNLDGFFGEELVKMNEKIGNYKNRITTFMGIDFTEFDSPYFPEMTRNSILESYTQGARGIKLWKNITLYKGIRMDNPKLNVIYETAAELDIPILVHIADPIAFFRPLSSSNERYEELIKNPEWNFSDRSKYPSFEELMAMQEKMIQEHPKTKFVIAHMGSYAENLAWVAEQLDKYPNMFVDIAARVAEVGRVPYSAKRFFTKYSKRILYGTDSLPTDLRLQKVMFRFLETDDEYFPYQPEGEKPDQGRFSIYGISLPDEALKDIYYRNACSLLHIDVKTFEKKGLEK
ncbi:amidohydrolase family protein [Bulleidia sp. zg-1006]|uniref:amidohydrolase family protein n=1 Tax=Bulleidia sp. zg-1006 TaxID=2806552 RepID=UPI00193AD074|nr:amidohydrolase family protein [Bulleidia sp. zg-1006]QRG86272.1 amidohydrolase family protein [Bulleidia sp. zg-1006]